MPDASELRVSDEERESAVREIREHFAAGRLDDDELAERIQAAYAARTAGELAAIRADLPPLPATRTRQKAELAERRAELRAQVLQQSGASLVPFTICTGIWAFSGADGFFWPGFLLLFALMALARNLWRLYGPAPEFDRVEQDLARRQRGDRERHRGRHRHHRL
jgi:hypothetical protein